MKNNHTPPSPPARRWHRSRRFVAGGAAASLIGGVLTLLMPAQPAFALGSCTWTDGAQTVTASGTSPTPLVVAPGDTVNVSCTGLGGGGLALVLASPLAGVASGTTSGGAAIAGALSDIASFSLAFTGGALSTTPVVIPPTGQLPAATGLGQTSTAPDAQCPPTQAQVDAGLATCALAVATNLLGTLPGPAQLQESVVPVLYGVTPPTPASPSVTVVSPPSGGFVAGNSVTLADGATGHWWTGGLTGLPIPNPVPPPASLFGLTATVGGIAATSNLAVSKANYTNSTCTGSTIASCSGAGSLTPPALSGTITWPSGVTPGSATVMVTSPDPQTNGATSATASTSANQAAAPTAVASPTSAGVGVSIGVTGTGWNSQDGPVSLAFTSGTDTGSCTADANGNLHACTITVGASEAVGSNPILVTQGPAGPGQLSASAAFTVVPLSAGPASPPSTTSTAPSFTPAVPPAGCTGAVTEIPINPADDALFHTGETVTIGTTPTVQATICAVADLFVEGSFIVPSGTVISGGSATINQQISETVIGVANGLTISESPPSPTCASGTNPDSTHVALSNTTLNGKTQHATGCLNTVQVLDARGDLVGWNLTGQMETDFSGPTAGSHVWDNVIPANNLDWTPARSLTYPTPPNGPSGVLSEVSAGSPSALPTAIMTTGLNGAAGPYPSLTETSTPVALCTAPSGGGGGTFNCDATLDLTVPAFVASGTYKATIDLVIS